MSEMANWAHILSDCLTCCCPIFVSSDRGIVLNRLRRWASLSGVATTDSGNPVPVDYGGCGESLGHCFESPFPDHNQ